MTEKPELMITFKESMTWRRFRDDVCKRKNLVSGYSEDEDSEISGFVLCGIMEDTPCTLENCYYVKPIGEPPKDDLHG